MPIKKKKDEEQLVETVAAAPIPDADADAATGPPVEEPMTEEPKPKRSRAKTSKVAPVPEPMPAEAVSPRPRDEDILTLSDQERGVTQEDDEDTKWVYLSGAARRRVVLTGIMSGFERLPNGNSVAVIDYQGIRVVIPAKEMVFADEADSGDDGDNLTRKVGGRLGATVDFIPVAVDMRNRAAVGSRTAAMLEKQRRYYASGRIKPGIRVTCRVVGISSGRVILEALGVEAKIKPDEVSHDWYADVNDLYSTGDLVVAKVLQVDLNEETGRYSVRLSIRQAQTNASKVNLESIATNANYFGTVTGVHNGVIFVRLQVGVNAKTKLYRSREIPSMHDTVSFHVNRVDENSGVAMGYITRIIKRHTRLR